MSHEQSVVLMIILLLFVFLCTFQSIEMTFLKHHVTSTSAKSLLVNDEFSQRFSLLVAIDTHQPYSIFPKISFFSPPTQTKLTSILPHHSIDSDVGINQSILIPEIAFHPMNMQIGCKRTKGFAIKRKSDLLPSQFLFGHFSLFFIHGFSFFTMEIIVGKFCFMNQVNSLQFKKGWKRVAVHLLTFPGSIPPSITYEEGSGDVSGVVVAPSRFPELTHSGVDQRITRFAFLPRFQMSLVAGPSLLSVGRPQRLVRERGVKP